VFAVAHTSGSLYGALSAFVMNGLNLLKIESRPIKGKGWEYLFFADFSGSLGGDEMDCVIRELMDSSIGFKILGNYKAAGDGE
jgi:chorismate mutase/prephenate dehydratase